MFQHKKQAFTLVELIVVITILAILGTIAFISLSGYSKSSRDSVRVTDTNNIKTSLELFALKTGKYPEPQNYKEVTYSGGLVWQEGVYGEETLKQTGIVSKDPKDPLEEVNYTYSRLNTTKEYELGIALERDQAQVINQVNAGDKLAISYITGNYNGLIAQVQTGSTTYVLAVPTIISTDPAVESIETLISEKKLAYTGYQNLPSSYKDTSLNTEGEEGLVLTNNLVAYSGSELPSTGSGYTDLITNLQNSYSGTTISEEGLVKRIIQADTNDASGNELLGKAILSGDVATVVTQSNTEENTTPGISCGAGEVYTSSGCVTGDVVLWWKGEDNLNPGLDSTGKQTATTTNVGVVTSSAEKMFGNSSLYFDGNNRHMYMEKTSDFDFGTGDFTVTFWGKIANSSSVYTYRPSSQWEGGNWHNISSNGNGQLGSGNSSRIYLNTNSVSNYNNGDWHHYAMSRKNGYVKLFVDGVAINEGAANFNIPNSYNLASYPLMGKFKVGVFYSEGSFYAPVDGYIDDFKIIKGNGLFDTAFNPYEYYCAQSEYASDSVCTQKCGANDLWCDSTSNTSCKYILDNSLSNGDGNYWIDPDGVGGNSPMKAYCDMTTDGGGWTMIASQSIYGMGNHNYWLENSLSITPENPSVVYDTWYKDLPSTTEMLLKSKDLSDTERWISLNKMDIFFNNNKVNEVINNGINILGSSGNWIDAKMNNIGQRVVAQKYYNYYSDGPQTTIVYANDSYTTSVGATAGGPTLSHYGGNTRPLWTTEYVYLGNNRYGFSGSDNITPRFWIYVR